MAFGSNSTRGSIVVCDGTSTDVTGLTGLGLLGRVKEIARTKGISKFDLIDGNSKTLDTSDIEGGNFSFPLTITRYNVAA